MYENICRFILMNVMLIKVKPQGLCEMRIVFVLDSTGLTDADWTTIKSFVGILASSANITQDAGQRKAGVVRFDGENSQLKHTCASMTTTAAFQSTVTNIQRSSGLTDIIGGLNAGREVMQSCSQDATTQNVAKYVVLMTDGMHNRPIGSTYNDIYAVADQIRSDGATIYGVAYGNTREAELNIVTENNLFSITQISELNEQLAKNINDELKCLPLMTRAVLTPSTTTTTSVTATLTSTTTNLATTTLEKLATTTVETAATTNLEISATTTPETSTATTAETLISITLETSATTTVETSATKNLEISATTLLETSNSTFLETLAATTVVTSAATTVETSATTTIETSATTTVETSTTTSHATTSIRTRSPVASIITTPVMVSSTKPSSNVIEPSSIEATLNTSSSQILTPSTTAVSHWFTSANISLITSLNTTLLVHSTTSLIHRVTSLKRNIISVMPTKSEMNSFQIPTESTLKMYGISKHQTSPLLFLKSSSASLKIAAISTFSVSILLITPTSTLSIHEISEPTTAIVPLISDIYTSIIVSSTIYNPVITPKPSCAATLKPTLPREQSPFYGILTSTMTWKKFCNSAEDFCTGFAKLLYHRIKGTIKADQLIVLNMDSCKQNPNEPAVINFYISDSSDNEPNATLTKAAVDLLKELISDGKTTDLATHFVNGTMQKAEFHATVDGEVVSNNDWPAWLISITAFSVIIALIFVAMISWIIYMKMTAHFHKRKKIDVNPTLHCTI